MARKDRQTPPAWDRSLAVLGFALGLLGGVWSGAEPWHIAGRSLVTAGVGWITGALLCWATQLPWK